MLQVFFFQAEDGIRDGRVTGVQTCALPISAVNNTVSGQANVFCGFCRDISAFGSGCFEGDLVEPGCPRNADCTRSEERRVGKECRARWWRQPLKKKRCNENESRE